MIKCAAILKDNILYTGRSHSHMYEKGINVDTIDSIEGFLTDKGEFVDRKKAAKIAFDCGQIQEEVLLLFSYMIKT